MAPDLLDKVTVHTPADKERATKLIAERMGANPDTDIRPGLLVQLAFAAADFAFQQWVRQSRDRAAAGSLRHRSPRSGQESALEKEADAVKASYKVAVWATGGVGKYAIRTIADRPNLELVGVWVHSDEQARQGRRRTRRHRPDRRPRHPGRIGDPRRRRGLRCLRRAGAAAE